MKTFSRIAFPLLALAGFAAGLPAATESQLVDLLVRRGVISAAEAEGLEGGQARTVDPRLLDLLVKNGALTEDDLARLQGSGNEPTGPAAPAQPESRRAQPVVLRPKQSETDRLTFNGRIQGQADFIDTDYDAADDPDHEANLFIRRLYFGAEAGLTDSITGVINANFGSGASGGAEIEKALIEWEFTDQHTFLAGYQKVPFGYEETTSSARLKTVERSVATRYFVDQLAYGSRFTGLYLEGEYDSGLYFTTALTNPEQGTAAGSAGSNSLAAWAQAGWKGDFGGLPWNLGASGGRLEGVRADGITDWVWGVHAVTRLTDLELTFEYLSARLEDARAGRNAQPLGFTLQGAWSLTPRFELVGRFSSLDLDGGIGADLGTTFRRAPETGDALYDEAQAYYLGGNWYFLDQALKLTAGYEWATYDDNLTGMQGDAEVNSFRTRLQLLY